MNPLRGIFQFIFGCRHRHMSRVFTIKPRTYTVCFDCGQEFDLPKVKKPVQAGISGEPLLTKPPRVKLSH
jgi:hypothetical protein